MGTRSAIGMEHPDGSITAIYCHWDGYLSHNGKILYENYGQEKLEQLLALGDISSLAPEIGEKHDFDAPPEGVVNAYGRDRGEQDIEATPYASRAEWVAGAGNEYNYLLDMDGVWHVSRGWSDDRFNFIPLKTALERENLIHG